MTPRRFSSLAMLSVWLLGSGCTALRELPRGDYASRPLRRNVRVETRDGLRYDFDHVEFSADSLTGFRRRDTDGKFEEFDSLAMPLNDVSRLSTRRVDWTRTGIVGGAAVAAVVTAALLRSKDDPPPPEPPPRPGP